MTTASERSDYFKNAVIVMLTLVSVFAALVTFLQNDASLRSSDLAQRSSFTAVNSTGLFVRAGLDAAQGTDALQRYDAFVQRAVRADTKARALRMGGEPALAAEYDLDAARWQQAASEAAQADPLLTDFNQDRDRYLQMLSRDAYLEEEREHNLLSQSRVWSEKANGYVAVLSTLSVALFLSGLSLTLSSRLRYLLALAGFGITTLCGLWVAGIALRSVPAVSEAAIQRFVDGRIHYNLANTFDRDQAAEKQTAINDFTAAIDDSPAYARAYFFRSLANTDSSLVDREMDTQAGIDDGLRALELGLETPPVIGNLGWLFYLNGQYRTALDYTERALTMAPDECYLTFNHGLILLALSEPDKAKGAYDEAIACARSQSSEGTFRYYMDVGVIDLHELSQANPDLAPALAAPARRLKEALATLIMYGEVREPHTDAEFGPLEFGGAVDADDVVTAFAAEFEQKQTIIYGVFDYSNVNADSTWAYRWLLDGYEYSVQTYEGWEFDESGQLRVPLSAPGGLNSGTYELDLFVDGALVTSGEVVVLPGELPRMTYQYSDNVGATISFPEDWRATDIADNEVSVVAARNPESEAFFGVTSWLASTGTDSDIFDLFELYFDAVRDLAPDLTIDEREPFTVSGLEGWSNRYRYTNADGVLIEGGLVGVQNASRGLTYIVVIEADQDEWDAKLDIINLMLERLDIWRE